MEIIRLKQSKARLLILMVFLAVLSGCSSNRTVVSKKQTKASKELEPIKLPSVNQRQHIKRLKSSGKKLNKYTLAYIKEYAALAVLEMHQYKIPASITLAQGILESGRGRSELARKSNNHFGIKCHRGWQGERVYYDDDEKGECFRKYTYVQTSYKDHSKFLTTRKRYANLFTLNVRDYKGWARGLKKAGYATDKKYPKKLIKLIKDYELYRFDKIKKRDLKKWASVSNKNKELVKEKEKPKKEIPFYYQVKKGDTLYSISKKYNISIEKLKEMNELTSNTISVGQHLLVK